MSDLGGPRLSAPSALRNRGPILDELRRVLPAHGDVLEIASGTGEHVVHFAAHLPGLVFHPSDPDPSRRASIDAWAAGLANVRPAMALDAAAAWPDLSVAAVLCINMIHISPWPATLGLLRGAASVLRPGGTLVLYGPFRRHGEHTAPSNAAFDADLQARDPAWGVRDLDDVASAAAQCGFSAPGVAPMPSNNLLVTFTR